MTRKIRKQIYIEPHQEALLKQLARQSGTTQAELVRQAIEMQSFRISLLRYDLKAWERERAFIRNWMEIGKVSGARNWKREDLYER